MKEGFTNKELVIPIELTWDYLGLDQSIDEYESEIIKKVTGDFGDFEVTRFAHAPTLINDPSSTVPLRRITLPFFNQLISMNSFGRIDPKSVVSPKIE